MRYFLLILPLFTIFFLSGCTNYLDKSITEKLTEGEIRASLEIDSVIYNFHTFLIPSLHNKFDDDNNLKSRFIDLTYRDFRILDELDKPNFQKYFDSIRRNTLRPRWEEKYSYMEKKIDSVYNYYYEKKPGLKDFIKIDLVDIRKKRDYYGYIDGIELGFSFEPLKGVVQQLKFNLTYGEKMDYNRTALHHQFKTIRPIKRKSILYFNLKSDLLEFNQSTKRSTLSGESVTTLNRDYFIEIEPIQLRFKDKNIMYRDYNPPWQIESLHELKQNGNYSMDSWESIRASIARKILNLSYERPSDFFETNLWFYKDSILKTKSERHVLLKDLDAVIKTL